MPPWTLELNRMLKLDREAFQEVYCLAHGVVTHDGLPFQLPVEMQTPSSASC